LEGIADMRLSATRDADQRYLLLAYRAQAFLELQSGRFAEAEQILPLIKAEIDRGMKAEEIVTRQDYHAIAGTLALERGDAARALEQADAGLAVSIGLSGSGSYANRYWTLFLIARVYLVLWRRHADTRSEHVGLSRNADTAYRLLRRLSTAHPIAAPSAFLIRGAVALLRGRHRSAKQYWLRASTAASALGMRYEEALARDGLRHLEGLGDASALSIGGLPLMDTTTHMPLTPHGSGPV
jgi:hypothetical protein